MIKKLGHGYVVVSHTGRRLSKVLRTRAQAKKRLAQVEMFKSIAARGRGRRR